MSRRLLAALAVLTAAALLAACGDDEPTAQDPAGDEPVTLRVGVIPIVDVAPLYLGMEQGFFEEENLQIEPQFAQGGAAIVPAVQSGDYDLGFSNVVSLMIAREQGLPLKIISPANQEGTTEEETFTALMVGEDSDIQAMADLAGATIAVNTLKNINELAIRASLAKRDLELSPPPEFVEVPIPDMPSALESGRVDAITVSEPFVTLAEPVARRLAAPYFDIAPGTTVATYFASEPYIDENPDVIERFQRAMERSLLYAQEHPDQAREAVLGYSEIEPKVAEEMVLPGWSATYNRDAFARIGTLAQQFRILEEDIDMTELIL